MKPHAIKSGVLALLGASCSCCGLVCAQIASGTVHVFQLMPNKFVIAADSRAIYPNKPPEDTACKIAALDRQFVVGVGAAASYAPGKEDLFRRSWDAIEEAKRIARTHITENPQDAASTVTAIADVWAFTVQNDWKALYSVYPERVAEAAKASKGILTTGLFAFAQNGQIAFIVRSITFDDRGIQVGNPPLPDCKIQPCASGQTDVPMEFIKLTSERALEDKKKFKVSKSELVRASFEMVRAAHLVDLTIRLDKSGTVGGPIDGVELFSDGSVHWYKRKANCPAN